MQPLKTIFLVLSVIFCQSISYAQQVVTLHDNDDDIVLNPDVYLFAGKQAGIHDIDKVRLAPDQQFIRNPYNQEVHYGFHWAAGWCKFTITNTSDHTDWVLKIQQSRVDSVQLFVVRENKGLEPFPLTGHFQNINQRPVHSIHFAFPVPIAQHETITCYLYTQRQFGRHATILNLQRKSYFESYEHTFSIAISFIEGMIILAALVGLVLYFFISDKIYLYYSIYCLSFFVLILADSGFLHAFISNEHYQQVINTFTTIFYYWIVGWHILFTVVLLKLKQHRFRWVYYTGIICGWLFCLVAILLLFVPLPDALRWWLGFFSYYIIFFMDAYILFAIGIRIAGKDPVVYFYLAGFLATLVVASLLVFADLQWIDGVNQNTDLYYFTPLVEILFMVLGLGIHFSKAIKEKLQVQLALNKTQHRIISIQEDERERIARDLHDDVGNSLAAVKNLLILKKDHQLLEKEIDTILESIRNISHNLMPVDFSHYALPEIIQHVVNKFKDHPTVAFEFNQAGDMIKLDPVTELVIYRIVNELIRNIIKHARASSAFIQLIYRDDSLVLMVEDNGIGMDKTTAGNKKGIGLKNIRHRAAYIRATLNFECDHKGTLAILEIPYDTSK
jgi:signal transduction histidine kinase